MSNPPRPGAVPPRPLPTPRPGTAPPPRPGQTGQVPPRQTGQVPPRQTGQVPPRQTGQVPPRPTGQIPPRQPVDLATRLDGQRGWLNELDNSLKKRSIIALVLTCLAVGVGAAAMYIAITKNSDGDRITALQSRVEALEAATGATTSELLPPTDPVLPETGVTGLTDPATGLPITPTGTTSVIPPE